MIDRLLHTPDGVRDTLNDECQKKQSLERELHKVLVSFGYRDLETPTFEFFDVFGREVGTTPSQELYKFFNREGNTLVLRRDFTPSSPGPLPNISGRRTRPSASATRETPLLTAAITRAI